FEFQHPVVALAIGALKLPVREEFEQHRDAALDEMDARRLEGLEESASEAERHAVLRPRLAAASRREAQRQGFRDPRVIETVEQQIARAVVIHEAAAIDMTIAGAMLQRNTPLPARG